MAVVRSTRYPQLWVHDLGVRFCDGVAEVDDPKVLARLARIDGVEVPEAPEVPARPAPRPRGKRQ